VKRERKEKERRETSKPVSFPEVRQLQLATLESRSKFPQDLLFLSASSQI